MKTRRSLYGLLAVAASVASIAMVAPPAKAGIGAHGGGSYVCRDAGNKIFWAEVVDLWEGKNLSRLKLHIDKTNAVPAKEQALAAIRKVKAIHGFFAEQVEAEFGPIWDQIQSIVVAGDAGTYLAVVPDSMDLERPRYCPGDPSRRPEYEQLINYLDNEPLKADPEVYRGLETETDRAAIGVHEAVFKVLRDYQGETDSRKAREIVGYLFSNSSEAVLTEALKRNLTKYLEPGKFQTEFLSYLILKAVEKGDVERIRTLLSYSTTIYGQVIQPQTSTLHLTRALEMAQDAQLLDIVTLVMEHRGPGFDINYREPGAGYTPLMYAAQRNRPDVMAVMMKAPELKVSSGIEFEYNKHTVILFTPMGKAIEGGCVECVKLLLQDPRFDLEHFAFSDHTPVDYMAMNQRLDMIRLVLEIRPDFDINKPFTKGYFLSEKNTLLGYMAILASSVEPAELSFYRSIMELPQVDVNAKSYGSKLEEGYTPLHISVSNTGNGSPLEVFKLLLTHPKIDVMRLSDTGESVLHSIVDRLYDESLAVEYFKALFDSHMEAKPLLDLKYKGNTPEQLAKKKGWKRLCDEIKRVRKMKTR